LTAFIHDHTHVTTEFVYALNIDCRATRWMDPMDLT